MQVGTKYIRQNNKTYKAKSIDKKTYKQAQLYNFKSIFKVKFDSMDMIAKLLDLISLEHDQCMI